MTSPPHGRSAPTTPHLADGARRADIRIRYGPSSIRPAEVSHQIYHDVFAHLARITSRANE